MTEEPTPAARRPARGLPLPLAFVLGGLAWWPVAFLPWLLGRSPDIPQPDRHHTPVPLLADQAPLLITCVLVGGLLSALALRFCRGALLARILLGLAGLLVVMVAVFVIAGPNSREIASDSISQSRFVTVGLMAILLAVTGVTWLVGLLALAGRTGWVVPGAALAAALPGWVSLLTDGVLSLSGWPTGVLIGLVLGVGAIRSLRALIWWVFGLAFAWVVGPLITTAVYSQQLIHGLSRRGDLFQQALNEVVAPCLQVLGQALLPANRPLLPWVLALVIGIVGLIVGLIRRRSVPAVTNSEPG